MCSVPLSSMTLQHVSKSNQGAICPAPQKLTPLNLCLRHHRCSTCFLPRENSPVRFWPWRRFCVLPVLSSYFLSLFYSVQLTELVTSVLLLSARKSSYSSESLSYHNDRSPLSTVLPTSPMLIVDE